MYYISISYWLSEYLCASSLCACQHVIHEPQDWDGHLTLVSVHHPLILFFDTPLLLLEPILLLHQTDLLWVPVTGQWTLVVLNLDIETISHQTHHLCSPLQTHNPRSLPITHRQMMVV